MKLKVALIYNELTPDRYHKMGESAAEAGVLDEVKAVRQALKTLGHECLLLPLGPPLSRVKKNLKSLSVDVVFNLFEGFNGSPQSEAAVAEILSSLALPFTGCHPEALRLGLDKVGTKKLLQKAGLPTPRFRVLTPDGLGRFDLDYPCIVKPAADDASHGISEDSVVHNRRALIAQVEKISRLFDGRALVEQFIDGREFNTTVIGLDRLVIPAISEIVYTLPPDKPRLLTYESKWQEDSLYFKNTRNVCPAPISGIERSRISRLARAAFRLTRCRGYARIDLRQDQRGNFLVLEINPNPDISPGAGLSLQLAAGGITYPDFINKMLRLALK